MVGWHHQLNGHEFEETPGDGTGQGSLVCCSPWNCKESDMTQRLNNKNLGTRYHTWPTLLLLSGQASGKVAPVLCPALTFCLVLSASALMGSVWDEYLHMVWLEPWVCKIFHFKTFRSVTQNKMRVGKSYSKSAFVSPSSERLSLTPSSSLISSRDAE